MDEPISLRQRLWLDCYLGQDWIRGFANAYFDYDPEPLGTKGAEIYEKKRRIR